MSDLVLRSSEAVPAAAAAGVLRTVVGNLASEPGNPKFRRIRLDGNAGTKLAAVPEAMALLHALGFAEEVTDAGRFLVAPEVDASAARVALATLERKLERGEEKLTLKQQARRDAERRRAAEQAEAKRQREETRKQIEFDKRNRKEDPNWKPAAAGVKGGKAIDTFRGKYGEDRGG
ncbi:hypothetical protein CTAYLR_010399 [Chrysophaeum taylorii]|uniref:PUB domain-containing protein n=1 Tax=Chrysophaeum taylorii TaxID=2483200 RepID=A0AAD7XN11_9STRA|nr:hypothetical protein CTAYLR_010399 [Chrysophaeum taylorii]